MGTPSKEYIISGGIEGKTRLNILAGVMHDHTKALLKELGVTDGMSFLDNGCGGGNVAIMAAQLVGEAGRVTAVDFDKEILALAEQDAIARNIPNIIFNSASAYDIDYTAEFDIAYARFLLSHLKNPTDALLRMKQSLKPGGRIIVEDVDFSGHFCYPPNDAFYQYVQYYTILAQQKNADANIGPALVSLFRQAGFKDVGFDVIQPCFNSGDGKWMAWSTFKNITNGLLHHNITDKETTAAILSALEEFTIDANSIMSLPRIFRIWGVNN